MHDYCLGLLMPIERKSVEPMAAVTAPAQVAAKHQSLLHFVGNAPWSDTAMLTKVSELVLPAIQRSGPIEAWIIDDTGFPKKGRHSVGVTRQYCGQLAKQDNCQVAVTLSLANHDASLPVAYRLYLAEDWAKDQARRRKANVPETTAFQTKPEIALDIERTGPETTPVHRAEHLNIAHWVEPKAFWDPLLHDRQQLAYTLLRVRRIDEIEVASFGTGEIGHQALIDAVRVGDDAALGAVKRISSRHVPKVSRRAVPWRVVVTSPSATDNRRRSRRISARSRCPGNKHMLRL
jgi:hypothetical protein